MYILIEGINEAIGRALPERMPGGRHVRFTDRLGPRRRREVLGQLRRRRGRRSRGEGLRRRRRSADAVRLLWPAGRLMGGVGGQEPDGRRARRTSLRTHRGPGASGAVRAWTSWSPLFVGHGPDDCQRPLAGAALRARGRKKGRRNEAIVHFPDGRSEEFAKVTGVHLPKARGLRSGREGAPAGPAGRPRGRGRAGRPTRRPAHRGAARARIRTPSPTDRHATPWTAASRAASSSSQAPRPGSAMPRRCGWRRRAPAWRWSTWSPRPWRPSASDCRTARHEPTCCRSPPT